MPAGEVEVKTFSKEGGHWYKPDGTPCYTVNSKDGTERPTTLRDAKKLGLLPSVTSIIKLAAAPGLEFWKQQQILLAALTLPKKAMEADDAYAARVIEDSKQQGFKAAELGTAIHASIEKSYSGQAYPEEHEPFVSAVQKLILEKTGGALCWRAEKSFGCKRHGYGGKVDLSNDTWVLDFKTKDFNESKTKYLAYDEHCMQLAACREGLDIGAARCANVFISTTKPGLVHWHEWDDFEEQEIKRGFAMFMALLSFWKAKNRI